MLKIGLNVVIVVVFLGTSSVILADVLLYDVLGCEDGLLAVEFSFLPSPRALTMDGGRGAEGVVGFLESIWIRRDRQRVFCAILL